MKWDEWRGTTDGHPVFFAKHLIRFPWLRVSVHKIIQADLPGCYHTHPAHAIRIILWGGYQEDCLEDGCRYYKWWLPGMVGWIKPELTHRFQVIRKKCAYTIWIKFKNVAAVKLVGSGWDATNEGIS